MKKNDGSTLVGAVVITLIMAIGVAGLMGVSRNTLSQEVDAHNEVRAFLAAEGGLDMLESWVRGTFREHGELRTGEGNIEIDGIPVALEVVNVSSFPNDDEWHLRSTANVGDLGYTKTLSWDLRTVEGVPGTGDPEIVEGSDEECDAPLDDDGGSTLPTQMVVRLGDCANPWDCRGFDICVSPTGKSIWLEIPSGDDCWKLGAQVGVVNANDNFCDYTLGLGGPGETVASDWTPSNPDPIHAGGTSAPNNDTRRDYSIDPENTGTNKRTIAVHKWGGPHTQGDNARMNCDHRTNRDRPESSHPNAFMPRRGNFVGPITVRSFMTRQISINDTTKIMRGVKARIMIDPHQCHRTDACEAGDCEFISDGSSTPAISMGRWNETNTVK
jgi:hypothetical protein